MIGHQHPTPHRNPARGRMLTQEIAVEGVIIIGEKRPLPAIAALSDMVRNARNDEAREPSHMIENDDEASECQ